MTAPLMVTARLALCMSIGGASTVTEIVSVSAPIASCALTVVVSEAVSSTPVRSYVFHPVSQNRTW